MDELLVEANLLLVIATSILAGVTVWYAVSTRRIADKTAEAARAARESAEAGKAMVRLEQERLWEEDRPDLRVHMQSIGPMSTTHKAKCEVLVSNQGKGAAEQIEMSGVVVSDAAVQDCACNRKLAESLGPGAGDSVDYLVPPTVSASPPYHLIFICHYTDIHSEPGRERAYHSLFDTKALPAYRTYRPHQPFPDLYRRACKLCRGTPSRS